MWNTRAQEKKTHKIDGIDISSKLSIKLYKNKVAN